MRTKRLPYTLKNLTLIKQGSYKISRVYIQSLDKGSH